MAPETTSAVRRYRQQPDMPPATPIKILHLINGEYYAGAERVQDLLAINLPAHGYEVSFACLKPVAFPKCRECKDAPLYTLPMRSAFDLRLTRNLIHLIREHRFALIHTHYTRSNLLGGIASIATGIPLVQHIHGVIGFDSDSIVKKYLNILVERMTMIQARQIIVVSDHLLSTITAQALLRHKLRVIHNGVPVNPCLAPRSFNKENPTLGTIAFWRPGKGLEELIRALHQLKITGQRFTLNVVGGFISGAYESEIKGMATSLDLASHIRWIGPTRDVNNCLRAMDIFVLPSFSEGLPMVILEAMAAGVPVVATNVGGISEAIRPGVDGLLVPARDHDALAKAIQTIANDARQWTKFQANAHQRQTDLFSDQHMTSKIAEIYSQLLGRHGDLRS